MDILRPVRGKIKNKIIRIDTEFGYTLKFKVVPKVSFNPSLEEEGGDPFFYVDWDYQWLGMEKTKKALSKEQITDVVRSRNVIPGSLDYEKILIGFVYSQDSDPVNHTWWLDFRDSQNRSVYNINGSSIKTDIPVTTTSWHDNIWHGRFVCQKQDVTQILYTDGKINIIGKERDKNTVDLNIPKDLKSLRLRFDINANKWYCDYIGDGMTVISTIVVDNLMCDAPMSGYVLDDSAKPKVSMFVNRADISSLSTQFQALMIRGK